jgi:ribonuclease BN (tRNA processing enzyme)
MSNSILEKLARYRALVVMYPPHTSHIFQVPDVLLSGLVKRSKKYQIRDDALPIHVDHILGLFRVYEAVMASTTIRAAWGQTGLEYEKRNMTTYLSINEGQILESRDFREIWMFDYRECQLSARRQKQKWGWINEHKFRKNERTMLRA